MLILFLILGLFFIFYSLRKGMKVFNESEKIKQEISANENNVLEGIKENILFWERLSKNKLDASKEEKSRYIENREFWENELKRINSNDHKLVTVFNSAIKTNEKHLLRSVVSVSNEYFKTYLSYLDEHKSKIWKVYEENDNQMIIRTRLNNLEEKISSLYVSS